MSIYTTESVIPPEFTHRKLERPVAKDNTTNHLKIQSLTYVIDFSRLKKAIGNNEELFYFYPQELDGFIISSVLSTQRECDYAYALRTMFYDLQSAHQEFQQKVEESTWRQATLSSVNGEHVNKYEITQAFKAGEQVMEAVVREMATIRDAHGDYAISARDFSWTPLGALVVKVYY